MVWGRGGHGELGDGIDREYQFPTPLVSLDDKEIVNVVCGEGHTVVLTEDGRVYYWGRAQGNHSTDVPKPVPAPLTRDAIMIAAASTYSAAITCTSS